MKSNKPVSHETESSRATTANKTTANKKLTLERQTVRTLGVKAGLRAGDPGRSIPTQHDRH